MSCLDDLQYSADHEWFRDGDAEGTVGVTAYATNALGDVVYIALPAVGSSVSAGERCGEIESTKSVSDLVAPVTGEVTALNELVVGDPSLTNSDPYGRGWLYRVRVKDAPNLMTPAEYADFIGELD